MNSISNICNETGLSTDDIRLILMDIREDWATCLEITDAERELILDSSRAKLNGDSTITPVDPNQLPIETQQKLVQSAAQVLNTRLMLAIAEEIQIFDAIDQVKNQVILANHQNRQKELAQAISVDWRDSKEQYLDTLRSLSNHLISPIEVEQDTVDAHGEIAKIRQEMGKLLTK